MADNTVVIDAGALALHFIDDVRIRSYFRGIEKGTIKGYMAHVNLGEYYYKTCQHLGKDIADIRYLSVTRSRITIFMDEMLARDAGLEKCRRGLDLSLADYFALAIAKRFDATLLTTDGELAKAKDVNVKHFAL